MLAAGHAAALERGLAPERSVMAEPGISEPAQGHAGWEAEALGDMSRPEVRRHLERFLARSGIVTLERSLARAQPYLGLIRESIRALGLPPDLAWLPVIESEFLPTAVSSSGAVGLWQFMGNSIAGLGMRVDEWRDDRRDFVKATKAALVKLSENRKRYGDWLLALAAYNCGGGLMDRLLARHGKMSFWELSERGLLPAETREYVPKFLAASWILSRAGRHGLSLSWGFPTEWRLLPVDKQADLRLLAEAAGIDYERLRAANAELIHGITPPPGSGYTLKVLPEWEGPLSLALASANPLLRFYSYTVLPGDTLSALAAHYGVSVAMIASYNKGIKPESLRIGQRIIVPALRQVEPYKGNPAYLAKLEEEKALPFDGEHVVKKGDTLWSIATAYGLSVDTLAKRNGIGASAILSIGQSLKVPIR
jgi:membrane-bound lytic murein transglycosylase D